MTHFADTKTTKTPITKETANELEGLKLTERPKSPYASGIQRQNAEANREGALEKTGLGPDGDETATADARYSDRLKTTNQKANFEGTVEKTGLGPDGDETATADALYSDQLNATNQQVNFEGVLEKTGLGPDGDETARD